MNDFERQYLRSANTPMSTGEDYNSDNYQNLFYINSLFMDDYFYDESFYQDGEKRGYQIYFDTYKNAKKFMANYNEQYGTVSVGNITSGVEETFIIMAGVLLPLAFLIMFLAILFYGNLIGTELAYNSRFISAFNYAGYNLRDIIRCFIWLNTLRLLKICAIASAIAVAITIVINFINSKIIFIGFQIFTYNPMLIIIFVIAMCFCAAVSINIFLRRTKAKTWYENIIASRI